MRNRILTALALTLEVVGLSCSSSEPGPRSRGTDMSGSGGSTTSSQAGSPSGSAAVSKAGPKDGGSARGGDATGGSAANGGTASDSWGSGEGGRSTLGGSTGAGDGHPRDGSGGAGGSAKGGHLNDGGSSGRGGPLGVGGASSSGGGGHAVGGSGTAGIDGSSVDGGPGIGGTGSASGSSPSTGCGKTPTLTSGSRTIQSGGQNRSFMLRIPSNYDKNHPYRLIFAFHWNGGTMNDIDGGGSSGAVWSYYGLQAQANDSTIFVAPQGNGNGWANSGGADLKFVDDMIGQIEGDLCVDTTRLFAMGFSYGGGMSYEIACSRAKVFRGVAVYSGAQLSGCDGGKDPIAYLGIHGVSDGTCNISGGRSLRDTFVKNNGCSAESPPEPKAGSGTHTCTTYTGCTAGHPVEWCAFDGGHTPGMVDGGGDDGAKTWTKGEAWKFFTQF